MNFLDTNVIVYASDGRDPRKQGVAQELLAAACVRGTGVISSQVALESGSVSSAKLGFAEADVAVQLRVLALLAWSPITHSTLRLASELRQLYRFSYWDSTIVAAALEFSCERLYSEDLQDGLQIGPMRIIDPFRTAS